MQISPLKIAFISYEYPPDTAVGGIATYVYQAAQLLQKRGHHVEVFAGSHQQAGTTLEDGILVHRLCERDRNRFPDRIGKVFADRHSIAPFDVLEAADIYAEARSAVQHCPDLPLVLKLHTPMFLCQQLGGMGVPLYNRTRFSISAIRRGNNPFKQQKYNPQTDIECLHALEADEVVILTEDMVDKVIRVWGIDPTKVSQIPNPYIPSDALLRIPADTTTNVVTFIGRLELRKGILDLARAIPLILKECPDVRFRFVGKNQGSPNPKFTMQEFLQRRFTAYDHAVEFLDAVPLEHIPSILSSTDLCVFPSIWENFPNVCLEAMAAARGIVGSSAGGMAEMLDHGTVGKLVAPQQPKQIADAVIELVKNPALRMQMGEAARDRLLTEYGLDRIGQLLENSYIRAIQRRKAAGSRTVHQAVTYSKSP